MAAYAFSCVGFLECVEGVGFAVGMLAQPYVLGLAVLETYHGVFPVADVVAWGLLVCVFILAPVWKAGTEGD